MKENKKYILNITPQQMKEVGFHYDYLLQEFVYEFPVYRANGKPDIVCKIVIDEETKELLINVYHLKGSLYKPYYDREYGKSDVLNVIDKNIATELQKLGAKCQVI